MKILITRPIPQSGIDLLTRNGHEVQILPHDRPCTREELLAASADASALITMLTDKIDADFLAARPNLKAIANYAVGYNNIDLPACTARKIPVSNTPDVLTDATAEIAWTLLFMAARRAGESERNLRAGKWTGWGPLQFLGLPIMGQTLGIIGAGRIGTQVARMSRGFKMRILYHHHRINDDLESLGASLEPLPDLLRQSDFISLHVPLTSETRHLIGERELALMKPTAILINTARGPVIDEAALVHALQQKRIFAAGLDVYEEEPKIHPALLTLENAVLLPHLGSATIKARNEMSLLAAGNLLEMLAGRKGKTQLNDLPS